NNKADAALQHANCPGSEGKREFCRCAAGLIAVLFRELSGLRFRARPPVHLLIARMANHDTGRYEKNVREPIKIMERVGVDVAVLAGQADQQTLGAAAYRACQMTVRGGRVAPRQDEFFQRRQLGVQLVQLLLEFANGVGVQRRTGRQGEFSAYIEEHVLYRLRSEEHTSELQSRENIVCRLLLENNNDTC